MISATNSVGSRSPSAATFSILKWLQMSAQTCGPSHRASRKDQVAGSQRLNQAAHGNHSR